MNEEELKKGCGKKYVHSQGYDICGEYYGDGSVALCPNCSGKLEGFQKGKLEERERIIEVVKGFLGRNDYQRFIKALDKKISKISRKRRIGLE